MEPIDHTIPIALMCIFIAYFAGYFRGRYNATHDILDLTDDVIKKKRKEFLRDWQWSQLDASDWRAIDKRCHVCVSKG